MAAIGFWTPISYRNSFRSLSIDCWLLQTVDSYFYLGGKKAEVISGYSRGNAEGVRLVDTTPSLLTTALKIASYVIVILPFIMLVAKVAFRLTHHFYVIPQIATETVQGVCHGRHEKQKLEKLATAAMGVQTICRRHIEQQKQAAEQLQGGGSEQTSPDGSRKIASKPFGSPPYFGSKTLFRYYFKVF